MKKTWRILAAFVLASTFTCAASAQPVVSAVLNAASYDALVSPGCLVSIFGSNLAPAPASAAGVSVSVAGLSAPLLYVSPGQINALIPFETAIPANSVV